MIPAVAGMVGGLAMNVVEVTTNFLITLFTLFFLFRDSPALYKTVREALPLDQKAKTEIFGCLAVGGPSEWATLDGSF